MAQKNWESNKTQTKAEIEKITPILEYNELVKPVVIETNDSLKGQGAILQVLSEAA